MEFTKQHFLPKCYLKEFTNSNGKFYYLNLRDLNEGRKVYPRETNPDAVCYDFDYYTIDDELKEKYPHLNKCEPLEIERGVFSKFENNYNSVINKIKKRVSLNEQDVALISEFCIDVKTRNQYWRENFINKNKGAIINESLDKIVASLGPNQLASFPEITSEEELNEVTNNIKTKLYSDPDFAKNMHVSGIISRRDKNDSFKTQLCNMLASLEWAIIETNFVSFFLTSDNPGFSIDKDEKVYNTRFAEEFVYFLPLTPCYCLMIRNQKLDVNYYNTGVKIIKYAMGNDISIGLINKGLRFFFNKLVFAQTKQSLNTFLTQLKIENSNSNIVKNEISK